MVICVEQERVIRAALNRPEIEPGIVVGHAPGRNVVNHVCILAIDLEEVDIELSLAAQTFHR